MPQVSKQMLVGGVDNIDGRAMLTNQSISDKTTLKRGLLDELYNRKTMIKVMDPNVHQINIVGRRRRS